jgi:hypothetical protein
MTKIGRGQILNLNKYFTWKCVIFIKNNCMMTYSAFFSSVKVPQNKTKELTQYEYFGWLCLHQESNVTPDDGIICQNIYIEPTLLFCGTT